MEKITKTNIRPHKSLNLLSQREIAAVLASEENVFQVFRNSALAILNSGMQQDDGAKLLADYRDFDIRVVPESRGIKLSVFNAPQTACVDGAIIRGIQEHLFAVLRDIVYTQHRLNSTGEFDLESSSGITDAVFRILRNADVVRPNLKPNLVVCWGGHSISRDEYDYSKEVGYQLGLRGLDIGTGCGIGAMKGPMKGAAVGHAKQQIRNGRYIGISEPGIIASESPNAIVNELVILPDIEKRLEAFVRLGHCIIVFPGGAGTAEEVLYLLGILMHPQNSQSIPLIFAAPEGSEDYFESLDRFLCATVGDQARQYYQVVTGAPEEVARLSRRAVDRVMHARRRGQESYGFNWNLHIDMPLQEPFIPSHQNMAAIKLDRSLPAHELASQLRCAFSGIVAGNVKAYGIEQIAQHGPYQLNGDPTLLKAMDALLSEFIAQHRMKLATTEYQPCYQLGAGGARK